MKRSYWIGLALLGLMSLAGPALAQNDHYPQYMIMGNTAYNNQRYDLAIEYYESAIDDNQDWWPAYVGLGNCYFAKKKLKDALKNYEKAFKINPDNPTLARFLNNLRYKMGIVPTPTPMPSNAMPPPFPVPSQPPPLPPPGK